MFEEQFQKKLEDKVSQRIWMGKPPRKLILGFWFPNSVRIV